MIHLALIVAIFLFIAYLGLVALDVVMSLYEQSKIFGFLALVLVIVAAEAMVHLLPIR